MIRAGCFADKGGEQNASRDYHGREILELLQNANDAAAEKGETVKFAPPAFGLFSLNHCFHKRDNAVA